VQRELHFISKSTKEEGNAQNAKYRKIN